MSGLKWPSCFEENQLMIRNLIFPADVIFSYKLAGKNKYPEVKP